MSYSYIKSVFPNFEDSNKVYDESLYSNIVQNEKSPTEIRGNNNLTNLSDFSKTLPESKNQEISLPQEKLIEQYRNIEPMSNNEYAEIKYINPMEEKNNLTFYNKPSSYKYIQDKQIVKQSDKHQLENFSSGTSCDGYPKHIFECNRCKLIVMKQLGIETDRIRNEEIMEIISYILFGLFILILIDYLKNDKK